MTLKYEFLTEYAVAVEITGSVEFCADREVWFVIVYYPLRSLIAAYNHQPSHPRCMLLRELSLAECRPKVYGGADSLFGAVVEIVAV